MHISKLAPMTLIKNNHNMFLINIVHRVLLDKSCQFLYCRDNDMSFRIFQLSFQNHSRGITVSSTFFETVILLHCLIVQVFPVHHKKDLIDIG